MPSGLPPSLQSAGPPRGVAGGCRSPSSACKRRSAIAGYAEGRNNCVHCAALLWDRCRSESRPSDSRATEHFGMILRSTLDMPCRRSHKSSSRTRTRTNVVVDSLERAYQLVRIDYLRDGCCARDQQTRRS